MSKPKYTYAVECQNEAGAWVAIITNETRDFCCGYVISSHSQQGPKLAIRYIRSDGVVQSEDRADLDVCLGMLAGHPTAEQYEGAAERALKIAGRIRAQTKAMEERRAGA